MEIIKFLQNFSSPFLDRFFIYSTMLGEESVYIILISLVFWCINKRYAYRLGFAFLFNGVVNGMVKNIVKAPRPLAETSIFHLRVETATGYSFPSGHTQSASVFWTTVMLKEKKGWLYVLGAAIILMVAASRMYLGLHWPADVAFGILFGFVCAVISGILFDYSEKIDNKHFLLILVIPSLIGLIFFKDSSDYVKAVAVVTSFYLGYIIEDKYINLKVKCSWQKQLLKFLLGITGIFAIKTLVKILLPEAAFSDFLRYFLIGIWTTIVAPWLFKVLGLEMSPSIAIQ